MAAATITPAAQMRAALDAIEEALDPQIYPEQIKDDFDAPRDREYTVTITAGLWRQIGAALTAADRGAA